MYPVSRNVGQLQERWNLPTDHLPIGIQYDDVRIVSWNVLNTGAIKWILEDGQGLKRSMIGRQNVRIDPQSELTIRDVTMSDYIIKVLENGASIVGLQECSYPFLDILERKLPEEYELLAYLDDEHTDQTAIIYNQNVVNLLDYRSDKNVFSARRNREVQNAIFSINKEDNGEHESEEKSILRVINAHLPGGPGSTSPEEFSQYILQNKGNLPMIAMGDMNKTPQGMQRPYYDLYAPYCTNISPERCVSIAIDHFLVANIPKSQIRILQPDEILPGLDEMVRLLN